METAGSRSGCWRASSQHYSGCCGTKVLRSPRRGSTRTNLPGADVTDDESQALSGNRGCDVVGLALASALFDPRRPCGRDKSAAAPRRLRDRGIVRLAPDGSATDEPGGLRVLPRVRLQ